MHNCPYCEKDLGDLDPQMDQLAKDPFRSKMSFQSKCCNSKIKAYSRGGMYYISTDGDTGERMIAAK